MDEKHKTSTAHPLTSATGGSFEKELREVLRQRTRLMAVIVFAVAGFAAAVNKFLVSVPPDLQGGLVPWEQTIRLGILVIFGIAFGLTYVLEGSARKFQLLAFWVVAVVLVLSVALLASVHPAEEPYLAVALTLFVYAVFIPSPARYPLWLGVLALVSFVMSAVMTHTFVVDAPEFWEAAGGVTALRNHVIVGATGVAILGFVAYVASRTLYSLRQTAHEATRLGNYIVEDELGEGGMGKVFRARHSLIRRPTAVKVMQVAGEEQAAAILRFEREVQLSATLSHPNTITIYDFGHTPDNRFYYVMEYLQGLDMQKLVDRFGPMTAARGVFILTQVCGALSEAHERGIIHRDIKPSNVFLTQRGGLYDYVKVLDFGLAKQVTDEKAVSLTKTGVALGTPRYISPEAIRGAENIDARSDLYCLGAVAYFMLTGRPPFDAVTSAELMIDHLKATPPSMSEVSELPIPADLEAIIMKCLQKAPEDRYGSAAEMESALRAVPIEDPWDQAKAHEWWDLHGLAVELEPAAEEVAGDDSGLSNKGISQFIYDP
jgi:serine/threonine-protein kinase